MSRDEPPTVGLRLNIRPLRGPHGGWAVRRYTCAPQEHKDGLCVDPTMCPGSKRSGGPLVSSRVVRAAFCGVRSPRVMPARDSSHGLVNLMSDKNHPS